MSYRSKYLISVILRLLAIFSKFILVMYISTEAEVIGYYVLILSVLSYMLYFTGVEYHSVSNRNLILSNTEKEKASLIEKQFSFYLVSNLICSIFIAVLYYLNLINIYNVFLFTVLMIFEHISLEISRILIATKKQLSASVMIFVKSFGWIFPFILFFYFTDEKFSIDSILYFWLTATVVSTILGFWLLRRYLLNITFQFNFSELKFILSSSAIIFISTILIRSVAIVDKVYIENNLDVETLAVYGFFLSIATFVTTIMEVSFFQYVYQKMVSYAQQKKRILNFYFYKVIGCCFLFSIFFSILVWFGINYLIYDYIDAIYTNNINILPVMLISSCFINLSFCCHYYIYSLKYDLVNLLSNLAYFIVYVFIIYFYGKSLVGVTWALLLSSISLFIFKFSFVIIALNKKSYD